MGVVCVRNQERMVIRINYQNSEVSDFNNRCSVVSENHRKKDVKKINYKDMVFCVVNGPLLDILSFLSIKTLVSTAQYVSKTFKNATEMYLYGMKIDRLFASTYPCYEDFYKIQSELVKLKYILVAITVLDKILNQQFTYHYNFRRNGSDGRVYSRGGLLGGLRLLSMTQTIQFLLLFGKNERFGFPICWVKDYFEYNNKYRGGYDHWFKHGLLKRSNILERKYAEKYWPHIRHYHKFERWTYVRHRVKLPSYICGEVKKYDEKGRCVFSHKCYQAKWDVRRYLTKEGDDSGKKYPRLDATLLEKVKDEKGIGESERRRRIDRFCEFITLVFDPPVNFRRKDFEQKAILILI